MRSTLRSSFLAYFVVVVSILDVLPGTCWANDKPVVSQDLEDEELLKQGQYQTVIEHLSSKVSELNVAQLKNLGRAYSGVKNSLLAIKTLNMALAKSPKDPEISTLVGLELLSTGKDREAMVNFRDAIKIDPKFEPAYLAIEKIYIRKNNKYELRMLYTDMIDILGEKPQYYTRLCEIYNSSGLYLDANESCKKGMKLDPSEPMNFVNLALSLKEQGEKDECIKVFKSTVEKFPQSEVAQLGYAQFLDAEKNYIDANNYYRATVKIKPDSLKALIGLALTSLEIQKFQEAYDALDKACQVDARTLKEVRRAMGIVRTMKQEQWYQKLDALSEHCGIKLAR